MTAATPITNAERLKPPTLATFRRYPSAFPIARYSVIPSVVFSGHVDGRVPVMKLSELRAEADVHERDMRDDPEYRREIERTQLATDVAIKVIRYRTDHGMTQAALARMLGMRQPHVARLEAGAHEPSVATLARLADVLGLDFSLDIKRGRTRLRYPARAAASEERKRA